MPLQGSVFAVSGRHAIEVQCIRRAARNATWAILRKLVLRYTELKRIGNLRQVVKPLPTREPHPRFRRMVEQYEALYYLPGRGAVLRPVSHRAAFADRGAEHTPARRLFSLLNKLAQFTSHS